MKKIFCIVFIIFLICFSINFNSANAEGLNESIEEEFNKIDLTEIENISNDYFTELDFDFIETIKKCLNGEYDFNFQNIFQYIKSILLNKIQDFIPLFSSLIIISILYMIIDKLKTFNKNNGISEVISFVFLIASISILYNQFCIIWDMVYKVSNNIAKITEIISPIILTLMLVVGGNTSVAVYKPSVLFFCEGVLTIFNSIIIPLISLMMILNVISCVFKVVNLSKFPDFIGGIIKWLIGIITSVYSLFLTVQGVTSATYDGLSYRITKYALSNSLPMIGGFIKDGVDFVLAGSIVIKNAIGLGTILFVLLIIISPVIYMGIFSLMLKLFSSILTAFGDDKTSELCIGVSKGITYLTISLIVVGFMFFISFLLMILSANVI